jgi:hypothetical protein
VTSPRILDGFRLLKLHAVREAVEARARAKEPGPELHQHMTPARNASYGSIRL